MSPKWISAHTLLVLVLIIHEVLVLIRHQAAFGSRIPSLAGAVGTVLMAFLIAIVNATIAPFQCVSHPNGLETVLRYSTNVCGGEDGYFTMVGLGVNFMLVPGSFFATRMLTVYLFPSWGKRGETAFLHAFAFLFCRFKPEAYWFVDHFNFRNMLAVLTDHLFVDGLVTL